MHDLRTLRDNIGALRDAMRRRGKDALYGPVIDRAEALDGERRAGITEVEALKAQRNANAQDVGKLKKSGAAADAIAAHLERGRALGEEIGGREAALAAIEGELQQILLEIPNITLPDVPAQPLYGYWGPKKNGKIE